MTDINDFKVLRNKCIKITGFLPQVAFSNDDEKARFGFYHLVLESIVGITDIATATNAIIDTEYNKKLLNIDIDDLGIDAVYFCDHQINDEKPIYLFNFKYVNNFKEATTPDNDISRSLKFIEYLDLGLESIPADMGKKVKDKLTDIRKKLNSNDAYRIYLYMVSNRLGGFSGNSESHIKVLMSNYGVKVMNFSLDDINKFIFNEKKTSESKFMVSKDDFLSFEGDNKSTKKSFIVKVSLVDVVRVFSINAQLALMYNLENDEDILNESLNIALLYDNVRGYLEESSYNKKIKETLREDYVNFFMYNNGITVTAEEIISEPKNSNEKYLFTLKNFQIVNGGQTIRTIFSFLNEIKDEKLPFNLRNTFVLARMFKIEKDNTLKNAIAEYTNSQNQISAYDLKSIDNIQIQIESYLKDHEILYVRKSGNVGEDSTQYKYRISKEEMAQIIHSIQGFPDRVTNVKVKLFIDYYDTIFSKTNFPFEKIVKYVRDYFEIRDKLQKSKDNKIKVFYVLYIIYSWDISIDEALSFLNEFIKKIKATKNIAVPRLLIQATTREALLQEIECKKMI